MVQQQNIVTKNYRARFNELAIGESLFINVANRISVSNIISAQFHETTDKRFSISKEGAPKGLLEVKRVEPVQEVA